jgi:hypothetical protein
MDISKYLRIHQNQLIIYLVDIRINTEQTQISYLSNEVDTNNYIILSQSLMNINLHL